MSWLLYVSLPAASGLLFYATLRWGPKSWADPECGATLIVPAFIAALAISGVGAGVTSRLAGRRGELVAATAIGVMLLAAAVCVAAFLIWFGQNQCGE